MTTTEVKLGGIEIDVTDVTDVIITDAQEDTENGGYYVREVRVYGEPDVGSTTQPLIATLRLRATTESYIEVTAPEQTF